MRFRTTLSAVAALSAALALTACGSDSGSGGSGDSSKAATATSAEDLGGMDALVAAAKKEGALNVIALPPDWANYGAMLDAFTKKYGITINSAKIRAGSRGESC